MIGPVRTNNANLGDSGVAPDFLEVSLEEFDIRLVHGKTALFAELGKTRVSSSVKPSITSTGSGSGTCISSVSRASSAASRASTGLIT